MQKKSSTKYCSIFLNVSLILSLLVSFIGCEGGDGNSVDYSDSIPVQTSTISIDGKFDDWADIEPIVIDSEGDVSSDGSYLDVSKVYLAMDEEYIYIKIDVAGDIPNGSDIFTCYKVSFWSQDGRGNYQFDVWFNYHEHHITLSWTDEKIIETIKAYPTYSGFLRYDENSLEFKVKKDDIDFDLNGTLLDLQTFGEGYEDYTISSKPLNFDIDFFTIDLSPASIKILPVNQKAAVSIIGASAPYSISVKDPTIATAEYIDGKIIVSGKNIGSTIVKVSNAESNSKSLPVTVGNENVIRPLSGTWSGTGISFDISDDSVFVNNLKLSTNNTFTGINCDFTLTEISFNRIIISENDKIDERSFIAMELSGTFTDESTLDLALSYDGYEPHCDAVISGTVKFFATKD